jgi:hypothetical protein
MTPEGVTKLLLTMTRAYPNYHPSDMKATAAVWHSMLANYEDKEVAMALRAYIVSDTKGFPPAIGQIIDLIHVKPSEMSELEAWGLVARAIRNGNYGAEEEYAKLPEEIQIALGSPNQIREWAQSDSDSLGVAQSNFLRSYRTTIERQRKADKMSPEIARLIRKTANHVEIPIKDETRQEGVPMPEELKKRLEGLYK